MQDRGSQGDQAGHQRQFCLLPISLKLALEMPSGGPHAILWHGCCVTLTLGRELTGVLSLSYLKMHYFPLGSCLITI